MGLFFKQSDSGHTHQTLLHQRWSQVLFLHYRCDKKLIEQHLPPGLSCDTINGSAFVSVIPFQMSKVRLESLPTFPYSTLWELNLRTYVTYNGVPGIYFFTLDSTHRLANVIARRIFRLPYRYLDLGDTPSITKHAYNFIAPRKLEVRADVYRESPIEHSETHKWLCERYCLFTYSNKNIYSGRVTHDPWQLHPINIIRVSEGLRREFLGIEAPPLPDLCAYSEQLDVHFFPFQKE